MKRERKARVLGLSLREINFSLYLNQLQEFPGSLLPAINNIIIFLFTIFFKKKSYFSLVNFFSLFFFENFKVFLPLNLYWEKNIIGSCFQRNDLAMAFQHFFFGYKNIVCCSWWAHFPTWQILTFFIFFSLF